MAEHSDYEYTEARKGGTDAVSQPETLRPGLRFVPHSHREFHPVAYYCQDLDSMAHSIYRFPMMNHR